jgi:hypothetical protein
MQMPIQRFCRATRAFSSDGGGALAGFAPDKARVRGLVPLCVFTLMSLVCLSAPVAAEAADSKPAGFAALAPGKMTWSEAQAYCASKGGKLPLVGGSKSFSAPAMGMSVDGFGSVGATWPSDVPAGYYWTGTENSRAPEQSVIVDVKRGNVNLGIGKQKHAHSVVCVP